MSLSEEVAASKQFFLLFRCNRLAEPLLSSLVNALSPHISVTVASKRILRGRPLTVSTSRLGVGLDDTSSRWRRGAPPSRSGLRGALSVNRGRSAALDDSWPTVELTWHGGDGSSSLALGLTSGVGLVTSFGCCAGSTIALVDVALVAVSVYLAQVLQEMA